MARRKSKVPIKGIVPIVLAVAIAFVLIDANGCTLKQGVDMSTLDPNDFLYGENLLPFFCNVIDYNDSRAIGVLIEGDHQQDTDFVGYQIDGTQDLEGLEGFEIPINEPVPILIIEDPDGEGDIEIPQEELDMLQNMTEGTNPIVNATVDPPEMLPTEPTPVNEFVIITEVTKIFTDGTEQTETSEFQFIPLQIFVEDTSNKDFSQGRLITKLSVRSDPNTFVEGSGKFDMLLNNMTINPTPIDFRFSGTTNQNGIIPIQFISPTGVPSADILLNIEPLQSDISLTGITPLEFKIFDVTATVNTIDYAISGQQNVFEFDFFRDPNIIFIIDSSGNEVRGFPTDDLFRFGALDGSSGVKRCYKNTRYGCWMTQTYRIQLGSPTIAGVEVTNSAGDLIFQNLASFTKIYIINNEPITRNDTYTVKYGRVTSANAGSLPAGEFTFTTPETQMNYRFYCTISQSTSVQGTGWCGSCTGLTGSPFLSCNLPR